MRHLLYWYCQGHPNPNTHACTHTHTLIQPHARAHTATCTHRYTPHPLSHPAAELHGRFVVTLQWATLLNVHDMVLVHSGGIKSRDETQSMFYSTLIQ